MATKKNEMVTEVVSYIPVEKLYLGSNLARDTFGGPKGHTKEDIEQLKAAIREAGGLINAILVGPRGYRDENHPNTAPDQYPVLGGFGRSQAYIGATIGTEEIKGLRDEEPNNPEWRHIAAKIVPLTANEDGVKKAEMINWYENIRIPQTSIALANMWAKMMNRKISVQLIAKMFNESPATVSNRAAYLTVLPDHIAEMIVQAERSTGPWEGGKKYDRKGIEMAKPRETFFITAMRDLRAAYEKASKIPNTGDYHALANALYAHWEKSGQWDVTIARNFTDGVRARFGLEPKEGRAKAKTEESQTTQETETTQSTSASATNGTTPGNGKDKGAGRADTSGDPKENVPAATMPNKTARQVVEEAKKPTLPANEEGFNTTGAMKWLADILGAMDNESAKALGYALGEARWVYNQDSKVFQPKDADKVLQAIALVFPVAATASN